MIPEFWQRQGIAEALFPQLLWSRPENRQQAGKLLIVGGNYHAFKAPAEAYTESLKAGIGSTRILLPNAVQKIIGPSLENGNYAASTPSGSFSQKALGEVLDWCRWADGVLLAGDLGHNSETAILIEKFLQKSEAPTAITKDAMDYIVTLPHAALERPNTVLVPSFAQLQRLGIAAKFERPLQFSMDMVRLVEWLHLFTDRYAPHIIVKHLDQLFVAVHGEISSTKLPVDIPIWRLRTATHAIVWWIQNTPRPFEALSTAVFSIAKTVGSNKS